jgi:hypothetical protein
MLSGLDRIRLTPRTSEYYFYIYHNLDTWQ